MLTASPLKQGIFDVVLLEPEINACPMFGTIITERFQVSGRWPRLREILAKLAVTARSQRGGDLSGLQSHDIMQKNETRAVRLWRLGGEMLVMHKLVKTLLELEGSRRICPREHLNG